MSILVTGGTGTLGRPTMAALRSQGHAVTALSRRPGEGRAVGNLSTGEGLDRALDGVATVVHCATTRFRDIGQTEVLIDAAERAGVEHVVFVSIVGVDDIPYFYYRDKVASEQAFIASDLPLTILRATQFHDFVAGFLRPQRRLPVLLVPELPVQPIAVEDVAERLVEIVAGPPLGRTEDIGGPMVLTVMEAARQWQRAHGTRRRMLPVRVPGALGAGFRAGHHTTGLPGYGRRTFAEYAAEQAAALGR
ncbi:SDR family oxidoreductase [Pseudactinotalea suaedae]|uniref:SDR family oxidoreductase n=1 Tax=Pseudactinotalea suaedae TaxID=1524924 RepID=UPI0012E2A132|nr:NAD(P)H-binding protein [Pseudactinotalea suaedae]